MPRRLIPIAVSALALLLVLWLAGLDALRDVGDRIRWGDLPLVVIAACAILVAFSWRWRALLRERLPFRRSVLITTLGLAGNQLLPLRAGDGLRVVLSGRGRDAPSVHAAVSALALEKVFDLLAVAGLGIASLAVMGGEGTHAFGTNVVAVAGGIVGLAIVLLLGARTGSLHRLVQATARTLRVSPRLYRHALRPLRHLRASATPRRVATLLVDTALIWIVLYTLAYLSIARMVQVPLTLQESTVLLFAAALGLALPAAPSGLGTFHAAIVSAFIVLKRPAAEGLVLAVAIHAVFFVTYCAAGAIALAFATRALGPLRLRGESP